jgi:hypothetical protein
VLSLWKHRNAGFRACVKYPCFRFVLVVLLVLVLNFSGDFEDEDDGENEEDDTFGVFYTSSSAGSSMVCAVAAA